MIKKITFIKKMTRAAIVILALISVFFLFKLSFASGPQDTLGIEAESGTLSGPVITASDPTASNGQYIQFVSPTSGPTPTPTVQPTPTTTPIPTPTPTATPTPLPGQLVVTSISPVLSGNGMNGPKDMALVGNVIWVVNASANSISLFNPDGTTAGNQITGNGLAYPYGITTVPVSSGTQVWVTNKNPINNVFTISRFNPDGTIAGAVLSQNGLSYPKDMGVVGNQVWISNSTTSTISRFNFDGTSAGKPITGNGLANPGGIAVVGNEAWVSNDHQGGGVSRFNFDGTMSNPQLANNSLLSSKAVGLIKTEFWVVNNQGGIKNSGSITRFLTNGSFVGVIPPPTGNFVGAYGIVLVGNQVWISNQGNKTISRFQVN